MNFDKDENFSNFKNSAAEICESSKIEGDSDVKLQSRHLYNFKKAKLNKNYACLHASCMNFNCLYFMHFITHKPQMQ